MSRVGKAPVEVPNGVEVKIEKSNVVTVKGPKGTLTKPMHKDMKIVLEGTEIKVARPNDDKENRALHGLTQRLLQNMVTGVTEGFEKTLLLNGVGYKAAKQGKKLVLQLGYSHPVEMEDPAGIETATPDVTTIIVRGADKEAVGQHAAVIREKRPPEPYKGKGIKYSTEHIRRKAGKAAKK